MKNMNTVLAGKVRVQFNGRPATVEYQVGTEGKTGIYTIEDASKQGDMLVTRNGDGKVLLVDKRDGIGKGMQIAVEVRAVREKVDFGFIPKMSLRMYDEFGGLTMKEDLDPDADTLPSDIERRIEQYVEDHDFREVSGND